MRCFGKQRILLAPLLDVEGSICWGNRRLLSLMQCLRDGGPFWLSVSEEHAFASGMGIFRLMIKGHTECAIFP